MGTTASLVAVEVQQISPDLLSWEGVAEGIEAEGLPTRAIETPASHAGDAAVVSWRWDRDPHTGRSRNLALALKHAQEAGIQYVFVDLVSIDQTLPKPQLIDSVVGMANLFASIPAIAAYDEELISMDDWGATLQRPWILSEIRALCQNPTRVTHVGYRESPSSPRDLSFANQVSVIRSGGYADCIFEVLSGRVGMTEVADFASILAEFTEPVSACYSEFGRADYLLSLFILTAGYERRQTVSRPQGDVDYGFRTGVADPMFDRVGLERFTLGPYRTDTGSFESARALVLDGREVAVWRSKMTSSYDRNWIQVLPEADDRILESVKLPQDKRDAWKAGSGRRTAFLRIDKNAPRPSIREKAASLAEKRWLERTPDPKANTLEFDPALWK